jgi:hypothetical protein
MDEVRKTTDADYRMFAELCGFCVMRLGLTEWEVRTAHRTLLTNARAIAEIDHAPHVARLILGKVWHEVDMGEDILLETALHEALHVLLSPMAGAAHDRFVTEEQLLSALESVTCRLTNLFLPMMRDALNTQETEANV